MPQPNRSKNHTTYLLSDTAPATIATANEDDTPRTFSGVANSGKPFSHYGRACIVDLAQLNYPDKIPVLIEHDRSRRAGVGVLSVVDNELLIQGTLLSNVDGTQIADDADEGFPWQLSAHVIAGVETLLTDEATAVINGHTVKAPITILQQCRISEVSFTPTGVDSQTSAVVLSDDTPNAKPNLDTNTDSTPNHPKETSMTLDEALAKINELQAQKITDDARIKELVDQNTQLKADKAAAENEAKKADVEAKLSAKGFGKDDKGVWQGVDSVTVEVLLSLDTDKADAIINGLSAPRQAVPDYLLSEQHGMTVGQTNHSTPVNPLLADIATRAKGQCI